ncbi:MAG: class I SAM-dependent methyltransferase [Chloroflexi bacterium]|nr:class I SAM-dependent methyltransferase [Chloroflexota bacterium]
MAKTQQDNWQQGLEYDEFMGRWSKPLAAEFLTWLAVPTGLAWLEIGCGTGSLTHAILEGQASEKFLGIDPSESFVAYSADRFHQTGAEFEVGTGNTIPTGDNTFDIVTSSLVLNFIPDIPSAIKEMQRVTKPDGIICGYVWDYAGKMEMLRYFWDAAIELNPAAKEHDEGQRFHICDQNNLIETLNASELAETRVEAISINMHFRDFDDYWQPFLGKQGPAPSYLNGLSSDHAHNLKELLLARLPVREDGSIKLLGQAWAFRAVDS